MSDKIRAYIKPITFLLEQFPCVVLLGARQVGKSTLLRQVLPQAPFYDLERQTDFDRIDADPEFFLADHDQPIVLDEAQYCPKLFNALRVHIDRNRKQNGQFLLSGSSSPSLLHEISETLAGRSAILEIGSFSLGEAWPGGISAFYGMIGEGRFDEIPHLPPLRTPKQVVDSCFLGGYPEPFLKRNQPLFPELWMENYFKTYVERDIQRLFPGLRADAYRRFIQMLGFSSGKIVNYANFARSLGVSQPTAKSYFQIAEGTFLWRQITSFDRNPHKRVTKMPKGYLRDTGLIHHLLHVGSMEQMKGHPDFGTIWEAFISEQVIKGLQLTLIPFRFYYYRTRHMAEVDLVLENRHGIIPIEIKVGITTPARHIQTLKGFVEEFDSPCGFVINNGEKVLQIAEKIWQIPAHYL